MEDKEIFIRDFWRTFLLYCLLSPVSHLTASASECEGGQDIFATVRENSPVGEFIANLTIIGDPSSSHINLTLSGGNADWFFLDGKTIRLNSSITRVLDREVNGPVLMATVTCYEDGAIQSEHRITVEIINKNDNKPEFLQSTIQPIEISELTAVNSTAFTVQARDADGDTLVYSIDETSPDAGYFRVDLPNSGRVILNKSLDFETKSQLQLHLCAVEMNTKERYNTTTTLTINVTDGDDQYPQFQPCTLLSLTQSSRVCGNPLYTVNITEQDEETVLDFSPGPIHAVDGDEGLNTPLTYTILSGADNGRFVIDSESGEVKITRRVENRLQTPTLRLRIMAAQADDPMKYSVATALVRVLAENRFPPQFSRAAYHGFVSESTSPASLVITYGSELLILEVTDRDFTDGFNPKLQYSLNSDSNISHLYYVTQEGLLIAKANQLQPNHKHSLEVLVTDQESGDVIKAVIDIEVLEKGVPVPQGPLEEGHPHSSGTVGRTGGVVGVCLILLAVAVFVLMYFFKKKRRRQDPANRASVAEGKHPNVMNHSRPQPLVDEVFYHNEAFSGYDDSTSNLHGKQGLYTKTDEDADKKSPSNVNLPSDASATPTFEDSFPAVKTNGKPMEKSISKSVSFQDFVVVRECDSQMDEDRDRSGSEGLEDFNIDLIGISAHLDGVYGDESGAGSELGQTEQINTESERLNADSERLENDVCHVNQEETGEILENLEPMEPLDVKMIILQEDSEESQTNTNESESSEDLKSDKKASKDATNAESSAESDYMRSSMINPDVTNVKVENPDVKLSKSEGPDAATSTPEVPNKSPERSEAEGDCFHVGMTEEEEGKVGIKIIVTVTDEDETNADSADEESEAQDRPEKETLRIKDVIPDTPQHSVTEQLAQAEETENAKKQDEAAKTGILNTQDDSEDISTNLDSASQDESNPPALFNPDINQQSRNLSDLSHLAANNKDTNIQT